MSSCSALGTPAMGLRGGRLSGLCCCCFFLRISGASRFRSTWPAPASTAESLSEPSAGTPPAPSVCMDTGDWVWGFLPSPIGTKPFAMERVRFRRVRPLKGDIGEAGEIGEPQGSTLLSAPLGGWRAGQAGSGTEVLAALEDWETGSVGKEVLAEGGPAGVGGGNPRSGAGMSPANWPGGGRPDPLWEPAVVTCWNALGSRSWAASVALGTGSVARASRAPGGGSSPICQLGGALGEAPACPANCGGWTLVSVSRGDLGSSPPGPSIESMTESTSLSRFHRDASSSSDLISQSSDAESRWSRSSGGMSASASRSPVSG
mmetsp:Transcript_96777/g.166843  ORF Transcript_96777/g.166843 Transcript_96777/m.166843 type:complete len:318 (+) Transcript_96777:555-1508(+)